MRLLRFARNDRKWGFARNDNKGQQMTEDDRNDKREKYG